MSLTPLGRLVAALRDPARYPHPAGAVEVHETHISVVLVAGEFAYKLKKPLNLGFLDFGTLEKRRTACEDEVRLNRRTAPDLYLDVVPIGGTPEEPRIGVAPAVEYAVRMRRFDQSALLDRVAARGAMDTAMLVRLARDLAAFHAAADAAGERPYGGPDQALAPARDNFAQLAPLVEASGDRELLDHLDAWTAREHARVRDRMAARRAAGRVRECHGDLHLGNIVVLDGRATPFDCIEFNDALRWIDVMSEVAFLVMDLVDHAHAEAAHRFLDAYLEATGDYDGLAVLPFYLVYRATVRAKIACIRAHQPGLDVHGRTRADAEYHAYLRLARTLSVPHRPAIVAMHGLSGSGKSHAAARLVERTGGVRVRSDVERKRLHGLAWDAASGAGVATQLYSPEATQRTYARLEALAATIADAGWIAIIDAASLRRDEREAFARLAAARGVPFVIVWCEAAEPVLRERIETRTAAGGDPSEATVAVLERQLAFREPLGDAERAHTVLIRTDAGDAAFETGLAEAVRRLRR
jgi:aminoglycoside phosphotransferase family enzyme/predicted kinase